MWKELFIRWERVLPVKYGIAALVLALKETEIMQKLHQYIFTRDVS